MRRSMTLRMRCASLAKGPRDDIDSRNVAMSLLVTARVRIMAAVYIIANVIAPMIRAMRLLLINEIKMYVAVEAITPDMSIRTEDRQSTVTP